VDGHPAPFYDGNGFELAISSFRGPAFHSLHYYTPGRSVGIALSLLSTALLGLLMRFF